MFEPPTHVGRCSDPLPWDPPYFPLKGEVPRAGQPGPERRHHGDALRAHGRRPSGGATCQILITCPMQVFFKHYLSNTWFLQKWRILEQRMMILGTATDANKTNEAALDKVALDKFGQFSKLHVCFCGLDPANLKFETVRTHKQRICF